jgi:hypothetical protein
MPLHENKENIYKGESCHCFYFWLEKGRLVENADEQMHSGSFIITLYLWYVLPSGTGHIP